ncbi:hypothetical protein M1116_01300 [Patescibacteria group bacterium]|nr:hypothetical protein [Patescibacteria group bacterium]
MEAKRRVLMITGLNNPTWQMWPIVKWWQMSGFRVQVFDPKWKNGRPFGIKFRRLLKLIDQVEEDKLSLVGISAGGSAALNAYGVRRDKINRVVTICSQLRRSRIFENRTLKQSRAFRQSVTRLEKREDKWEEEDLKNIMTVRSMLGDELVPLDTAAMRGAKNMMVPTGEHVFSIFGALTLFSAPIRQFMRVNP